MYTPKGSFEAQRYGEIYGFDPNATRRDLRRQGRQFKRYLKTDAADYDRQMFEQAEQARRAGELRARGENLNQTLAAGMRTPMQIDTSGAMERMNAGSEAADSRRAALAEEDLNNRIAGAARFNDAFRMARQAGLKTFTWKGNLYGTELAQPSSSTRKGSDSGSESGTKKATTPVSTGSGVQNPRRIIHNAMDANPGDFVPGKGGVPSSREQVVGGYGDTKTKEQPLPAFDFAGFGKRYGLKTETIDGKKYLRYDPSGMGDFYISEDGTVHMVPVDGIVSAPLASASDTPVGGKQRENARNLFTMIDNFKTGNYDKWYSDYIASHPLTPNGVGFVGWDTKLKWDKDFAAAKRAAGFKQGGRFNRVKYFQQGGAVQEDIMSQVQALVQAAAQGDEQATQQITQIMEAAKSGNQQAIQIAQMIQQVVEQMQGQAAAAKWGAKLGYIKSLKYAKGGKACPECEKKVEKKVEMKACGGKKAKKRYLGGLI